MNTKDIAQMNYYTKLIQRGAKTIEDVPSHLKDEVQELLKNAAPLEPREGETQ